MILLPPYKGKKMVTDKLSVTHQFTEELSKHSGKAAFMPASEIGRALQYIEENGVPNNKQEDYKYCNIEAILRKEFKTIFGEELLVDENDLKGSYYTNGFYNLYIVNGKLSIDASEIPANMVVLDINKTSPDILKKYVSSKIINDALLALNTAYADRGFFLQITNPVDRPVIIHYINSSQGNLFFNARNLFVIEKGVEVQITEFFHESKNKYFINNVTDISVAENAHCNHMLIQNSGETSYTVNSTKVNQ